jgi:cytoskeletal protein RodZ
MTTRDQARPVASDERPRPNGRPVDAATGVESPPPSPALDLPERLLAARERKGVDLYRAERDTKIRAGYLAALERGDYRALPGSVYTKGFLRNYALYLGLDPEDVLSQWRSERGEAMTPAPTISIPRPLTAPRRGLTFSPGILVAALLTLAIVAFLAYLGVQLLRFAKPPTIAVSEPVAAVTEVEDGVSSYLFAGTSIAGATIEIAASGREQPYRASADADGSWTAEVELSRGRNQFVVTAKDPDTGKAAEDPVERVIMVPFPVIEAPTLTVESPTDGATYENGAVPVTGRTTNADQVAVTAQWLTDADAPPPVAGPSVPPAGASPGASPAPSPSGPPPLPPITVEPADDGSFSAPLELTTGRWSVVVTATSPEGKTASVTRSVTVNYTGVNLVVSIQDSRAWLKVWVDGKVSEVTGSGGTVFAPGKVLTFTAERSIEVRTGKSSATYFTLNGVSLGHLSDEPNPQTWLFAPPAPPTQTDRR